MAAAATTTMTTGERRGSNQIHATTARTYTANPPKPRATELMSRSTSSPQPQALHEYVARHRHEIAQHGRQPHHVRVLFHEPRPDEPRESMPHDPPEPLSPPVGGGQFYRPRCRTDPGQGDEQGERVPAR